MKKYLKIKSASLFTFFVFTVVAIIGTNFTYGQVKVNFKPRESSNAPIPYKNVKNYNLQGDFTMIGNTNLTLKNYSDTGSNNAEMIFFDIDGDNNTKNSSSSVLNLPGGECTEIIYAGLYWSGRAHNGGSSPMTFDGFDKRKVKLKAAGDSYVQITAKDSDIYYPSTTDDNMYAAYADVTDYVREKGATNYFVADIALKTGSGGATGFYGGWGMVVIYKNSSMTWRDITVFDGYGYMASNGGAVTLPVSGFRAAQYGDVKVKLGMMAGEGDIGVSGDYFRIQKRTSAMYENLSHGANTTTNFFNSSIYTGGNVRNPNKKNNTGIDIAMFDLNNSGNSIINNGQTSTQFQYGTTGDTYIIYNIVFAVDAYVPEIVGENKATNFGGSTPSNNGTITPGQEFEFELDVYNKGTEAVSNSKIEIPVPFNLHYSGSTVIEGLPAGGSVAWVAPDGAPLETTSAVTAGGKIIWTIGTLPLDATKQKLLAKLKYRFKVSDNCVLLSTNVCGLEVRINGKISGKGTTSGTQVASDLVRDYGNGACAGPVYDDFLSTISVSADFLQNCNPPVENGVMQFRAFCSVPTGGFSRAEVVAKYPSGTKFFNVVPISYNSNVGLVTGNFPVNADGSKKMYYVMVPGMEANCYAKLEISVEIVTTSPTTKNVTLCYGETISLENKLSQTGVNKQYELVYFDAANNPITGTPNPTAVGTHRYFVAEGKDGCVGPKKEFTITINALPELAIGVQNIEVCTNFDYSTTLVASTGAGFSYTWEYSTTGGATWETLNNTTFSNKVALTNNKIEVKHAESQLNGTKVRLSVSNGQCTVTSNVFEIIVKDCPAMTNPMLLNPAIQ